MRGDLVNLNFKTFNKQRSGLIVKSHEIPHYAYSSRSSSCVQSLLLIGSNFKQVCVKISNYKAHKTKNTPIPFLISQ